MNFENVVDQLRVDDRAVRICDVADMILTSLMILDEQSPSFKEIEKQMKRTYNAMINSISMTLLYNLASLGKTGEEAVKLAQEIADSGEAMKVGIAVLEGKEQA